MLFYLVLFVLALTSFAVFYTRWFAVGARPNERARTTDSEDDEEARTIKRSLFAACNLDECEQMNVVMRPKWHNSRALRPYQKMRFLSTRPTPAIYAGGTCLSANGSTAVWWASANAPVATARRTTRRAVRRTRRRTTRRLSARKA